MTYPKIKPCPMCSGDTFLFGYEGWNGGISSWRVECYDCNYIGSCEGRKLDAIRAHNERAGKILSENGQQISALATGSGTAKTAKPVECEASQSGGKAATPNPSPVSRR